MFVKGCGGSLGWTCCFVTGALSIFSQELY